MPLPQGVVILEFDDEGFNCRFTFPRDLQGVVTGGGLRGDCSDIGEVDSAFEVHLGLSTQAHRCFAIRQSILGLVGVDVFTHDQNATEEVNMVFLFLGSHSTVLHDIEGAEKQKLTETGDLELLPIIDAFLQILECVVSGFLVD